MADKIQAPYTFVPLSPHVVAAPGDPASSGLQDVPVGPVVCSGVLHVRVHTESPIFVGARRGQDAVEPYTTPDGRVALPGSSLRGLIRNVVEIASFGALAHRVNDHRYGFRDLHNAGLYGNHMGTLDGKSTYPFTCAGFLRPAGPKDLPDGSDRGRFPAVIDVCSFAKVHYSKIIAYSRAQGSTQYDPGRPRGAAEKYGAWKGSLDVRCSVDEKHGHGAVVKRRTRRGGYGVVTKLGSGATRGQLVFTGQPSEWKPDRKEFEKSKQHDFVFYGHHESLLVEAKTLEDFAFIHRDSGQQNRLTARHNAELLHLLERFGGGAPDLGEWLRRGKPEQRLPVFFLAEERDRRLRYNGGVRVRSLGLAMMFRLAYNHSVGEAAARAQPGSKGVEDLADRIFGCVPQSGQDGRISRKGRVWFGDARPRAEVVRGAQVTAILASPKASYYPNYVEQGRPGDLPSKTEEYKTWQDADARPRGWKRVPPRRAPTPPYISKKVKNLRQVGTRFTPWRAPDGLDFKLRFHNLSPEELGAVTWALDFGGRPELRHTLGMAKQLGYGCVRLEVVGGSVRSTEDWDRPIEGEEALSDLICGARDAYAGFMEGALEGKVPGGWAGSRELFELCAAASVQDPGQRHMRIDDPTHRNEFEVAKNGKLVLPPVGNRGDYLSIQRAAGERVAQARRMVEERSLRQRIAALRDESVPPRDRVDAWAGAFGDGAVAELRRWFGFKGAYQGQPDPTLESVAVEIGDLAYGVVSYLRDHGGLQKSAKLPENRRALLARCLGEGEGLQAGSEASGAPKSPYDGAFPDWERLPQKKLRKARSAWVGRIATGGPWDFDSLVEIIQHLRTQGAPDGQLRQVVREQAALTGVDPADLGARLGVSVE